MMRNNGYRCLFAILCLACLPFLCSRSDATEIFFDDFEGYFDDLDLEAVGWRIVEENDPLENAQWTVLNPGGRINPPTLDGSPSTGQFLISDSDAAGNADGQGTGRSHDIWTPVFETDGFDTVWLHADVSAQLNNNGTVIFDIDVSVDDGASWTNVFRRVAPARGLDPVPTRDNADGFFGRLDVDISALAADESDVMLRFRQFEPDDDWWIAFDNLLVDDQPVRGGIVPLMPEENFDAGIPATWEVRSLVGNTGADTWSTIDACTRNTGTVTERGINRLTAPSAILDSDCDPDPTEDEFLITPTIDCSQADEVFLEFSSEHLVNGNVAEVLVSVDGGETFDVLPPVFSYSAGALFDGGEEPFFARRVFLVEDIGGEEQVAFAFHYQSGGDNWWWAIDDVKVTANGEDLDIRSCPVRNLRASRFDAATSSIDVSWASIPGDETFRLLANGAELATGLSAATTSYTHENPRAGSVVTYTLESIVGGDVDMTCESSPLSAFTCPTNLTCCPSLDGTSASLTWTPGANIGAQELFRNGTSIATLGADESSYDDSAQAPGRYVYTIVASDAPAEACPASTCHATLTGIELQFSGDCGTVVAQHEFNGDLMSSVEGGVKLLPGISTPLIQDIDVPDFSFEDMDIAGSTAQVCRYGRGTMFQLFTGLSGNGGGTFTNQYTLIMDVMFPGGALDVSGWGPLYQTNTGNANDGDWFVQAASRGIGIGGNYAGTIVDDTWHRVALSVDLVAGTYTSYIDGIQVMQNTGEALDGVFSLNTPLQAAAEGILIFADESGENSEGYVNSVQIRDVALTAGQVAAFGTASAEGIPFNPPFLCPSGLRCCVNQATREVSLTWVNGEDIPGTGWRIVRNGVPLRTIPLDQDSFVDDALPAGSGSYEYELRLNGADEALCTNLPLICSVRVIEEGAIFFDDFECYANDSEMTDAGWDFVEANAPVEDSIWTLSNPLDRANPPLENGAAATSGQFLISDSDFGGADAANPGGSGMSHDIWTPSFDCSGQRAVWLHVSCSAVLNNNGQAVFDVDVSTDGGESWTTKMRRVAPARTIAPLPVVDLPDGSSIGNADGVYGLLNVDLSEEAAGESNVRVRFRHFEPNFDWWIAIDDLLIDGRPSLGGNVVLMDTEGFSEDIPDDWTIDSQGTGIGPWVAADPCQLSLLNLNGGIFPDTLDGRQLHYFDETFALIGPDEFCVPVFDQDEYLITPVVDCTKSENVYIHFRSSALPANSIAEVLLSLDGGETFEIDPVFTYNGDGLLLRDPGNGDVSYGGYIIAAPDAAGEDEVAFGFHYFNSTGDADWWAIDDVKITADGPQVGTPFIRGDADASSQINITDGIFILNFLFLGGGDPTCKDAADADDSGAINITDGIYVLNFLFLGGPAPSAPHPGCGIDTTKDGVDCLASDACN